MLLFLVPWLDPTWKTVMLNTVPSVWLVWRIVLLKHVLFRPHSQSEQQRKQQQAEHDHHEERRKLRRSAGHLSSSRGGRGRGGGWGGRGRGGGGGRGRGGGGAVGGGGRGRYWEGRPSPPRDQFRARVEDLASVAQSSAHIAAFISSSSKCTGFTALETDRRCCTKGQRHWWTDEVFLCGAKLCRFRAQKTTLSLPAHTSYSIIQKYQDYFF